MTERYISVRGCSNAVLSTAWNSSARRMKNYAPLLHFIITVICQLKLREVPFIKRTGDSTHYRSNEKKKMLKNM